MQLVPSPTSSYNLKYLHWESGEMVGVKSYSTAVCILLVDRYSWIELTHFKAILLDLMENEGNGVWSQAKWQCRVMTDCSTEDSSSE